MGRTVQRALLIAAVGAAVGLIVNSVSPHGVPYITPPKVVVPPSDFVPLEEATNLWKAGSAVFFDARATADYEAGHIPFAFSLPAEEFDAHYPAVAPMLSPGSRIIAYCDGTDCDLSKELTAKLRELGFTNVHMLFNGWTVWRGTGLPTNKGGQP